ncbi:MAG: hypothetical protein ACI396_05785 [Acutalibacteraceae bacterium]
MKYETPNAEIVMFDDADIITTSGGEVVTDSKNDPYEADKF